MSERMGPEVCLSGLLPDGAFVGTSLILRRDGWLLYGIRRPKTEGSHAVIELTGIGGGMETADLSITDGAQREAVEEMGHRARILPCDETLIVEGPGLLHQVTLRGDERPCAVVFRRYRTPAHRPWDEHNEGDAWLVVFVAELQGEPWPSMELPALIWLQPEQVVQTARDDVPLAALLGAGARLIEKAPGIIPRDAWARLTDSQEALVLALGDAALSFYQRLASSR